MNKKHTKTFSKKAVNTALHKSIVILFIVSCVVFVACAIASIWTHHEHTYRNVWYYNQEYHWKKSDCAHNVIGEKGKHDFNQKVATDKYLKSPATCTQKAEYYYSCECGETGTTTFEYGTYAAHKEVTDAGIAPTRTEDGLTEGKHCSVCERVLVEQKVIPATGSVGLTFSLNSDGITYSVAGFGSCTDKEVLIPKKYSDGNAVTGIGEKAFENCASVTSITIPDTIKSIGNQAFYGCSGLTEIHIPSSVTKIGTQIFYKASKLKTVYYDSTYSSENNPFLNTLCITKVVIGAKSVSNYMLYKCVNVKEVILKSGVTSIGSSAFRGCTSLTSINIPDGVTSIGEFAFESCTSLTILNMPDGVTSIGEFAFRGCTSLTSINMPDGVTSIGDYAFRDCGSLTSISIPDSVTSIGYSAFDDCSSLTSISIPDSVTSIGNYAFDDCSSLTSISIPDSVTSIGCSAFNNCSKLTEIHYGGTKEDWRWLEKPTGWDRGTGFYTVYCTDGKLDKNGNEIK